MIYRTIEVGGNSIFRGLDILSWSSWAPPHIWNILIYSLTHTYPATHIYTKSIFKKHVYYYANNYFKKEILVLKALYWTKYKLTFSKYCNLRNDWRYKSIENLLNYNN